MWISSCTNSFSHEPLLEATLPHSTEFSGLAFLCHASWPLALHGDSHSGVLHEKVEGWTVRQLAGMDCKLFFLPSGGFHSLSYEAVRAVGTVLKQKEVILKKTLKLLVCFLDHTNGTRDDFGFCIQGLLLAGTKGPYVVLGIESRLVTFKANELPIVLSLQLFPYFLFSGKQLCLVPRISKSFLYTMAGMRLGNQGDWWDHHVSFSAFLGDLVEFIFLGGHILLWSGFTPDCALRDHSLEYLGDHILYLGMKPQSATCRANVIPTVLSLYPLT